MIYETYQASKDNNVIEVGFCFKESADTDDCLPFNLVLGEFDASNISEINLSELFKENEWAAIAIVKNHAN